MSVNLLFALASGVALAGALAVVLSRDVMRMALGLGAFLLAVAGFFALYGFGFLALAELFVYVGGVLVLILFAVMLVHRAEPGVPSLESRHDLLALVTCIGVVLMTVFSLSPTLGGLTVARGADAGRLGELLLSDLVGHFELAGMLLMSALVAVVAITRGGER